MTKTSDDQVFADMARDHAIRTIFLMTCASLGYDGDTAKALVAGLTEKLRREEFPTSDPAKAMYAADGVADAFEDFLKLDEANIATLTMMLQMKK